MTFDSLVLVLQKILPNKVFYGTNTYDDLSNASMPYIVYQEISRKPKVYCDNKSLFYISKIQVTLVTKYKNIDLEQKLEQALSESNFSFILTSEFFNADKSINRIYEINMEEI